MTFRSVEPLGSFFHDLCDNHVKDRARRTRSPSALGSPLQPVGAGFLILFFERGSPESRELEHEMHLGVMRRVSRARPAFNAGSRNAKRAGPRARACTRACLETLNVKCHPFSIILFFDSAGALSTSMPCARFAYPPLWTITA